MVVPLVGKLHRFLVVLSEEYIIPEAVEDLKGKNSLSLLMEKEDSNNLMTNLEENEAEFFEAAAVFELKCVYEKNININSKNSNKKFGNPFTGKLYTKEQISDNFELLINTDAQKEPKTAARDKDGESLKLKKKEELLMKKENISKPKQTKEKKVDNEFAEVFGEQSGENESGGGLKNGRKISGSKV